jgi:CubicO group peptidase (beta-lactamase class C family)
MARNIAARNIAARVSAVCTSLLIGLSLLLLGCSGPAAPAVEYPAGSFEARLESIRQEHNLPALAAAVVRGGELDEIGAVGVRKAGDATPVTTTDRFHVGSVTKSMTATLVARLVQGGIISWDTTIAEALPDLAESMDPAYRDVTIEQLLAHRAGLMPLTDPAEDRELWDQLTQRVGTPVEQRLFLAENVLRRPPTATPGTEWAYSNTDYAVAGAMLEAVAGQTWEELMEAHVFAPLGITTAGFGPPGTPGEAIDQPYGHQETLGRLAPFGPAPENDNPPSIAPAGGVHLSLEDYARYMAAHLAALEGDRSFLDDQSVAKLYTPQSDNNYALGWLNEANETAGAPTIWHNGSNTLFFTILALVPERDMAVLAVTNAGGGRAAAGVEAVLSSLFEEQVNPQ